MTVVEAARPCRVQSGQTESETCGGRLLRMRLSGGTNMDETRNAPEGGSRYADLRDRDQYTPDEAAYLLGIDNDVIHQAVHRGRLKATMVGDDILHIDRGDLVHWLDTR